MPNRRRSDLAIALAVVVVMAVACVAVVGTTQADEGPLPTVLASVALAPLVMNWHEPTSLLTLFPPLPDERMYLYTQMLNRSLPPQEPWENPGAPALSQVRATPQALL